MSDDVFRGRTDEAKLDELLASLDNLGSRDIDPGEMRTFLRARVLGQDHVIDPVIGHIHVNWAMKKREKPVCNLLFVGPPGTGKTELAKAIAEYLYGNANAMLRIDCGEYTRHDDLKRLIGADSHWQGAKMGTLTGPVLENPRQVILFDEIEKAEPAIFQSLLGMFGEGRLTDHNLNRKADFTQAIIVMTSNAEYQAIAELAERIENPDKLEQAIRTHLESAKKFSAEALDRFDGFCAFRPLERKIQAKIVVMKMDKLAGQMDLELAAFDSLVIFDAVKAAVDQGVGGARQLDNIIRKLIGQQLVAAKKAGCRKVSLKVDASRNLVIEEVD